MDSFKLSIFLVIAHDSTNSCLNNTMQISDKKVSYTTEKDLHFTSIFLLTRVAWLTAIFVWSSGALVLSTEVCQKFVKNSNNLIKLGKLGYQYIKLIELTFYYMDEESQEASLLLYQHVPVIINEIHFTDFNNCDEYVDV